MLLVGSFSAINVQICLLPYLMQICYAILWYGVVIWMWICMVWSGWGHDATIKASVQIVHLAQSGLGLHC